MLGYARYRMPVDGLYLCGSGAHPGGGVTGVPGRNAAREVVADARARPPRLSRGAGMRALTIVLATVLVAGALLVGCTVTGTVYAQQAGPPGHPRVVHARPSSWTRSTAASRPSAAGVGRGRGARHQPRLRERPGRGGAGPGQGGRGHHPGRRPRDHHRTPHGPTARRWVTAAPTSSCTCRRRVELELRTSNGRIEAANVTGTRHRAHQQRLHHHARRRRPRPGHDQRQRVRQRRNGELRGPDQQRRPRHQRRAGRLGDRRDLERAPDLQRLARARRPLVGDDRNANVTLTLPGDAAFTIDGSTSNGSVRTDFPRLVIQDTTIRGTTGVSSVTVIQATTSNGDLAVMQQRP